MRKVIALTLLSLVLLCPPILSQEPLETCGTFRSFLPSCFIFWSDTGIAYDLVADNDEMWVVLQGFDDLDRVFVIGTIRSDFASYCISSAIPKVLVSEIRICNDCCSERGDVDGIGQVNILDLTYIVDFIFRSGLNPPCLESADVNYDGESANINDLTFLVDLIFRGGPYPDSCPAFP